MQYRNSDAILSSENALLNTPERAVLVGIELPTSKYDLDSSMAELERLAHTAGAQSVGLITQRLRSPNPATFIGAGKASEIASMASALDASLIIFDDELTPSQQSNLEKIFGEDIKVIDRTALILDIFAMRAKSREGRLQVRLAQNEYLYPRLRGMWAHLATNRMGGGVGSRFGEGESQLEVDRRMVRKRITSIKRELKDLEKVRELQRADRRRSGIYKVALAGYTNAGKSSLLNSICDTEIYSDDLLFATLDSTTRKFLFSDGREATLTDTVGFIQKLPTTLVEAFKSTLDEITGADLILHVVDVSSDSFEKQIQAVEEIFGQIKADRIPSIMVFNKSDLLESNEMEALSKRFPHAQFVSAKSGLGIEELLERISMASSASDITMNVLIPFDRGDLVSFAHRKCHIISEHYIQDGTEINLRVPQDAIKTFSEFSIQ